MNKLTVLSLAISLISGYAGAQTIVLTDSENGIELGNWRIDSSQLKIPAPRFQPATASLAWWQARGIEVLNLTQ